jgi:hypothetical protein
MLRSPVSQGSYALRCVALPCRDCTGPKPFRLFSPYLAGLPGGRVIPHYGMFPGQSKVWSTKPPLADGIQKGECRRDFKNFAPRHA